MYIYADALLNSAYTYVPRGVRQMEKHTDHWQYNFARRLSQFCKINCNNQVTLTEEMVVQTK
jgi:hypothetical protein